jgi:hypothetical protein
MLDANFGMHFLFYVINHTNFNVAINSLKIFPDPGMNRKLRTSMAQFSPVGRRPRHEVRPPRQQGIIPAHHHHLLKDDPSFPYLDVCCRLVSHDNPFAKQLVRHCFPIYNFSSVHIAGTDCTELSRLYLG